MKKTLSVNVAAVMAARGMVQADLHRFVSAGTSHRVTTGQNLTLDRLQEVSRALQLPAWQLLHPDFDPANPPVVSTAAQIEMTAQSRVRELLKPLGPLIGGLLDSEESRPDGRSAAKPYPDLSSSAGSAASVNEPTAADQKRKPRTRRHG